MIQWFNKKVLSNFVFAARHYIETKDDQCQLRSRHCK